jgi:hypothetical protein
MSDSQTTLFLAALVLLSACKPEPINSIDPIKDWGAVCDGKHDDSEAFMNAAHQAEITKRAVLLPPNCVVRNGVLSRDN